MLVSKSFAVNTITHIETLTSNGGLVLQDGTSVPSAGGVTIGYFSSSAPSDSVIQSWTPDNAMSNLMTYGWKDIRTVVVTGAGMQNGGDWDWPGGGSSTAGTKIGGTYNWIFDAGLAGTQLYLFGFNSGSSSFGYNASSVVSPSLLAVTGSSFSSSTQWVALKGANWLLPASDNTALNVKVSDVDTAGELLVGTDLGNNVAMVPEPSTGALLLVGAAGLVAWRRLRRV